MVAHPRDGTESDRITSCPVHRLTRSIRILLAVCAAVITAGSLCLTAKADIPVSEYIRVYFEQDGKPLDQPVSFRITCYGYEFDPGSTPPTRVPGSYEPEIVYSISGNCPRYGCKIAHDQSG